MKNLIVVALLAPMVVWADDSSVSNSSATTASTSTSANQQSIAFNNPANINTNGSLRTTGNANLPAFSNSFSSDYCGSTQGAGVGGVGFSFSFAGSTIDSNCVKLRVTERLMQIRAATKDEDDQRAIFDAALEVIGSINKDVKKIMSEKGLLDRLPH